MEEHKEWLEVRRPRQNERCCICQSVVTKKIFDVKSTDVEFDNKICRACKNDFYFDWEVKKHGR